MRMLQIHQTMYQLTELWLSDPGVEFCDLIKKIIEKDDLDFGDDEFIDKLGFEIEQLC